MIAAEVFTVGLGIILTVALLLPTAYRAARRRWRPTVADAQAQARRDAARGVTAARLRHPSMRGKL